jgi:hypothetical protein
MGSLTLHRADAALFQMLRRVILDNSDVLYPCESLREANAVRSRWYRFVKAIENAKIRPILLETLSDEQRAIIDGVGHGWSQVVPLLEETPGGLTPFTLRFTAKNRTPQYQKMQAALASAVVREVPKTSAYAEGAVAETMREIAEGHAPAWMAHVRAEPTAMPESVSHETVEPSEAPPPDPVTGQLWQRLCPDGRTREYIYAADGEWRETDSGLTPALRDAAKRYY